MTELSVEQKVFICKNLDQLSNEQLAVKLNVPLSAIVSHIRDSGLTRSGARTFEHKNQGIREHRDAVRKRAGENRYR